MNPTRVPTYFLAILLGLGITASAFAQAPTPGECTFGETPAILEANDVLATVSSSGSMFFGPGIAAGSSYLVPRNSGNSPFFSHNIWVGGTVGGDLRLAASTYGQAAGNRGWELFPGPLNDDATLPNPLDCSDWDRIWNVTRQDILDYETTGVATPDIESWPWENGAPVVDGDGNPDNYDLVAGDRPDIIGDQSLFWIVNDVGGPKPTTQTDPIGVEIRIQAFAFARANALNQTTFYKNTVVYKGNETLEDTRITLFSDPDLGNAGDDLIGSDVDLSLGYVYNQDDIDSAYGAAPAAGYVFFQGALVPDPDGDLWNHPEGWQDPDGTVFPGMGRQGMTTFNYFENSDTPFGNPGTATHHWNYMQGLWRDGNPFTACGDGYQDGCDDDVTLFAYPGDPVTGTGWFEPQDNGADKRFMITTGPFTMEPGDVQEVVYGLVFAQAAGRLESLSALRAATGFAQAAYNANFQLAEAAAAPSLCNVQSANPNLQPGSGSCFEGTEMNESIQLTWGYGPEDPGYLGDYVDVFEYEDEEGMPAQDVYEFEGFNLYEYGSARFENHDRQLIATFDKANGITTVYNGAFNAAVGVFVPEQTASGTDAGLNYSFTVDQSTRHSGPLQNYTDYYFGLSTYAVDHERAALQEDVIAGGDTMTVDWGDVGEAVIESPARLLTVRPSDLRNADGGTILAGEGGEQILPDSSASEFLGGGTIYANVVDPAKVTGDRYAVEFFNPVDGGGNPDMDVTTYNIVNVSTGEVLFDGQQFYERSGGAAPEVENAMVFDGLSFTTLGAAPEFLDIVGVTPDGEEESLENGPCAVWATSTEQPYLIASAGVDRCQNQGSLLDNVDWINSQTARLEGIQALTPWDLEIRFVEDPADGQYVFNRTWDGVDPAEAIMAGWETADSGNGDCELVNPVENLTGKLPLTVWEVHPLGDERQVNIAVLNDDGNNIYNCAPAQSEWTFGRPTYERLYINHGEYDEALIESDVVAAFDDWAFWEDVGTDEDPIKATLGRFLIGPNSAPVDLPEAGSTIRFVTSKPNQAGDRYVMDASQFTPTRGDGLTQEDVDRIAVAPNPYKGFSAYESSDTERVARFTNLPQQATIRIFTIDGTLVRTLEKDNANRSFDWNLRTENDLPVGSGLYLIHIELPESGLERVLKFGVVNRQTTIPLI